MNLVNGALKVSWGSRICVSPTEPPVLPPSWLASYHGNASRVFVSSHQMVCIVGNASMFQHSVRSSVS